MIEIEKKRKRIILKKDNLEQLKSKDIIITSHRNQTTYNEDGSFTTKRIEDKINLTKRINESAKLIKSTNTTEEKLKKIEQIARGGK